MLKLKLVCIIIISLLTSYAYGLEKLDVNRVDVLSLDTTNLKKTLPIGYDLCNGGSWRVHSTNIFTYTRGAICTVSSPDLRFSKKYSPKDDNYYIGNSFAHGVLVTKENVAGIPFKRNCFL